jgi:hypothetical protein
MATPESSGCDLVRMALPAVKEAPKAPAAERTAAAREPERRGRAARRDGRGPGGIGAAGGHLMAEREPAGAGGRGVGSAECATSREFP